MGLIVLPSMIEGRKAMGMIMIILSIIYMISFSSADVSLQNTYATSGSETQESIYLRGVDYTNTASVYQTSYSASSATSPAENASNSRFEDVAYMKTRDGDQGAGLLIDASDLNYTRKISGGESDSIIFSYRAGSGDVHLDYFTPLSAMDEDIYLDNNSYRGNFSVFNLKAYSLGNGECNVDNQSSLRHNITMKFMDKFNEINAVVNTWPQNAGSFPLKYKWTGYSSQRDYALSGINVELTPGNRTATAWINGTSSIIEPKFSPDKDKGTYEYPLTINDQGQFKWVGNNSTYIYKANRTLVMQYRLNATGGAVNQETPTTE